MQPGDLRVAAALGHDLGAQARLLLGTLDQVMACERRQSLEEPGRLVDGEEAVGGFRPIALADAGDQGFLGGEIAIEIARTHRGLRADLLHRGAVKARARKAALGGIENLQTAVGLPLDVGATHLNPPTPDIAVQ